MTFYKYNRPNEFNDKWVKQDLREPSAEADGHIQPNERGEQGEPVGVQKEVSFDKGWAKQKETS